jgi:alginate O-acetyltransferase complex protein AlgJ
MRSKPAGAGLVGRDTRKLPLQSSSSFVRRILYCITAMLFVTLLVLPTADRFLGFAPKFIMAETDLTTLPETTLAPPTWLRWFDVLRRGYLERHYNLRSLLISWNSYLDTFVLASTTASSNVLAGKDHWLFLAQDGDVGNVIEEARFPQPLPEEPLAILVAELERRRVWLAERGIRYLVVIAPNKNTVYPEKLPEALRPLGKESHLAQFVRYFREHTKVDIVDVTPALMERKKTAPVFYITDSHWNAYGAFAAYQEIIKPLKRDFPAIPVLDRHQFVVEQFKGLPGDLSFMMGLTEHLKEDRIMFYNKDWYKARGLSYYGTNDPHYFEDPQYSVTGDAKLPNAVIFHDSFWWELLPFIAESFNKALYVWLKPQTGNAFRFFDTDVIEQEKPNIVIDEFTERYILPPLHGRFKIKNHVAAAKD